MPIFDPFSESAAILSNSMLNMSDLGGIGLPGGGLAYLLRDTFSVDFAAGSVNGTTCDTGQARTVTDSNSKLSITGGKASVATGGNTAGDPGLWYPAVTRVNGILLLGTFVITTNWLEFGWDSAAAGSILFSFRPVAGTSLTVRDNGGVVTVAVAPTTGVAYQAVLGLRTSGGAWYWIKGGVYGTKYKLVWTSPTGTANLLPAFGNVDNSSVYTVDDVRIPQNVTFIPTPLASDWFTRADGALGNTEATGPDSQATPVLAWQFTTGIWAVSSNKAVATPTLGSDVIVNGNFATDTDWTKGTGWTIGSGTANASSVTTADLTAAVPPMTIGRWYQVQYTLSAYSSGSVQARVGGVGLTAVAVNGTYTQTAKASGSTDFIMRGLTSFTGSVDNVSAKLLTTAELFSSVQVSVADVIADVSVTLPSSSAALQAGLVLNLDSVSNPQNFILCYLNGTGSIVLDECVAGTYTNKFTTGVTYSAGGGLRVIRDGTSARVFYNGSAVNSATMTANTNTLHGMFSTSGSNSLDFFTIWAIGNEGQYETLDNY